VTVANFSFTPSALTVAPGATVTWSWAAGSTDHNVTFDDGNHSSTQSSGTYQRTFPNAGTFPYHCTIHGAQGMVGTITVSAGGSGGGSSGGGGGTGGGGYQGLM
jgi:plastocyanin